MLMRVVDLRYSCVSMPSAALIRIEWIRHLASTLVVEVSIDPRVKYFTVSVLFSFFGTLSVYGGDHVYADLVVTNYM